MKKKGVMYSIIVLLLLIPSILLISVYFNTFRVEGQTYANEIRASDMKNFYNSLIMDVKRSLKISTFRAVLYAIQRIIETGAPLENSDEKIAEMIYKGTLDGEEVPSMVGNLENPCNTISCWKDMYLDLAEKSNYYLSIEIFSVDVVPYDSWNLNSSVKMKVVLKDKNTNMSISREVIESIRVPITGFEDPLYLLNTAGKVTRVIKKPGNPLTKGEKGYGWALGILTEDLSLGDKGEILLIDDLSGVGEDKLREFGGVLFKESVDTAPIPFLSKIEKPDALTTGAKIFFENITSSVWDLNEQIITYSYHESYFGPSFLDRLEGRTYISDKFKSKSSRPIGLLSFIDFSQFEERGIFVDKSLSCIDYLYFNGSSDYLC